LEPNSCLPQLTSIVEKKYNGSEQVNGAKVSIILQNIFLCVHQTKEIHTGFQKLEGE